MYFTVYLIARTAIKVGGVVVVVIIIIIIIIIIHNKVSNKN